MCDSDQDRTGDYPVLFLILVYDFIESKKKENI